VSLIRSFDNLAFVYLQLDYNKCIEFRTRGCKKGKKKNASYLIAHKGKTQQAVSSALHEWIHKLSLIYDSFLPSGGGGAGAFLLSVSFLLTVG